MPDTKVIQQNYLRCCPIALHDPTTSHAIAAAGMHKGAAHMVKAGSMHFLWVNAASP